MTTDAHTAPLTDSAAQPEAAAPQTTTISAPATAAAPSSTAPVPAYTAPAPTLTAPAPQVAAPTAGYAVPPQGGQYAAQQAPEGQQYAVPPQGHGYAVPPQSQPGAQAPHAPQYAAAPPAPQGKHAYGFAIASFVIGIASIVSGWTFVAPITGLVLGLLALRRNTTERTLALWGVWLNGVILGLAVLGFIAFIGFASFGAFAGAVTGWGY